MNLNYNIKFLNGYMTKIFYNGIIVPWHIKDDSQVTKQIPICTSNK